MKRIVIIHHHLNPGGVTRIIESQIKSLTDYFPSARILVITGHCEFPEEIISLGAEILIHEKLNYLPEENADLENEYQKLLNFLNGILKKDDVVHIHNLNLGKNPLFTLAISEFAYRGFNILNHAHDFAEDRPVNLQLLESIIGDTFKKELSKVLYPDLPNCLHATLNSFDKRRLSNYGIQENNIFLLPNPVSLGHPVKDVLAAELKKKICLQLNLDPEKKLVTYPVRVIRRKNIGEYILLAMLLSDTATWLVTQPPKNPIEIIPYNQWKNFCKKEKIDVVFEAGTKVDFEELIQASDCCVTTSIKEGFGMVYLEPWLFNTPVVGRDLPQITEDIKNSGIEFPLLYEAFRIPFQNRIVDFSSLSESEQQAVIVNIIEDKTARNAVLTENSFIRKLLNFNPGNTIEKNRSIIITEYSLLNYAKRLEKIYQKFTG